MIFLVCFYIKCGWHTKIKLVQGSSFLCSSSSESKFAPLGMHVNVHRLRITCVEVPVAEGYRAVFFDGIAINCICGGA